MNHVGRRDNGRLAPNSSEADQLRARMEIAAVDILEKALRRRHWAVSDRDKVAEALIGVLQAEERRKKQKAKPPGE